LGERRNFAATYIRAIGPTGDSEIRWRITRSARDQGHLHHHVGLFEGRDRLRLEDREQDRKIVLIDGSRLAELMIEFGVAVAADATYTVKRIDNDFFEPI
jgi:hypothetical protein